MASRRSSRAASAAAAAAEAAATAAAPVAAGRRFRNVGVAIPTRAPLLAAHCDVARFE
jgi:hypothetical protein